MNPRIYIHNMHIVKIFSTLFKRDLYAVVFFWVSPEEGGSFLSSSEGFILMSCQEFASGLLVIDLMLHRWW